MRFGLISASGGGLLLVAKALVFLALPRGCRLGRNDFATTFKTQVEQVVVAVARCHDWVREAEQLSLFFQASPLRIVRVQCDNPANDGQVTGLAGFHFDGRFR